MINKTRQILFLLGLIICLISSREVTIGWVPLDYEFGLLQALPLMFWAGTALMATSILLGFRNERYSLFVLKLFVLFLVLQNIPLLFTGNIYQPDALMSIQHSVSYVDSSAAMNYAPGTFYADRYETYTDWPLFFVGGAVINTILGMEPLTFAIYFPLIASALMFLSVACLYKLCLESQWLRFALLLYVPLNVWLYFHYVPKSLATPIFLLLFYCLSKRGSAWSLITIILMFYLAASHPPTSLVMMFGIVLLVLFTKFFRHLQPRDNLRTGAGINTAILFAVMFVSWMFFQAATTTGLLILRLEEGIVNLGTLLFSLEQRFEMETDLPWHYAPLIRFYVTILFSLLSLLSLGLLVLRKRDLDKLLYPGAIFAGGLAFLTLDFIAYHGAWGSRYMILTAITAPALIGLLLKNSELPRRLGQILCCLLLLIAALNFSTAHYRINVNIVSDTALSTADHLSEEFSDQVVVGPFLPPLLHLPVFYHTNFTGINALDWWANPKRLPEGQSYVIILDRYSELFYSTEPSPTFRVEHYEYLKDKADGLNRIYSNGSYQIYH